MKKFLIMLTPAAILFSVMPLRRQSLTPFEANLL